MQKIGTESNTYPTRSLQLLVRKFTLSHNRFLREQLINMISEFQPMETVIPTQSLHSIRFIPTIQFSTIPNRTEVLLQSTLILQVHIIHLL